MLLSHFHTFILLHLYIMSKSIPPLTLLKKSFAALYDFILPGICVTCGGKIDHTVGFICGRCREIVIRNGGRMVERRERRNLKRAFYLFPYEPWLGVDVGNAVRTLKYSGYCGIARELAALMTETLIKRLEYIEADAVIPIPLHPSRKRERGFNQSDLIARELARQLDLDFLDPLKRCKNTASQAELSGYERELNVKGAFELRRSASVEGLIIILVDDQFTTGATMNDAAGVLLDKGACGIVGLSVTH